MVGCVWGPWYRVVLMCTLWWATFMDHIYSPLAKREVWGWGIVNMRHLGARHLWGWIWTCCLVYKCTQLLCILRHYKLNGVW